MLWPVPRPFRSSGQDQQTPVDQVQNRSRPLLHRGSTSNREQRPAVLTRTDSRDNRPGRWGEADGPGGRRSHNRSSSTPPSRTHHNHPPQDGRTGLLNASANASWKYGEHWVNTSWLPGRLQPLQVEMNSQVSMVVHADGQLGDVEDHPRGRPRRSSDAKRPTATTQPAPAPPRPAAYHPTPSSPTQIPVIPGFTTNPGGGMGFRNLLRRTSRDRPKIYFYHKHQPYYGFTNFSPHPVVYSGKKYPTSEHLFQALKFHHKPNLMEHIRKCDPRPSVAFSEARRFSHEVRKDWKNSNIKVMDDVLYLKFTQHGRLKQELLSTGDAELIENSDKDPFWGCGPDGKGRNELGQALMRLRKLLREQERR